MVHLPSGRPRKSMCVPVGSVALGVRSHADGRFLMAATPRYGFGTTHTLPPAAAGDCGTTPSASTAARRPPFSTPGLVGYSASSVQSSSAGPLEPTGRVQLETFQIL